MKDKGIVIIVTKKVIYLINIDNIIKITNKLIHVKSYCDILNTTTELDYKMLSYIKLTKDDINWIDDYTKLFNLSNGKVLIRNKNKLDITKDVLINNSHFETQDVSLFIKIKKIKSIYMI